MKFKTHKGEVVEGEKLKSAVNAVVDQCIANSKTIREEDTYADHITEEQKDQFLKADLERYECLRKDALKGQWGFKIWFIQMLDYELTGEAVGILP